MSNRFHQAIFAIPRFFAVVLVTGALLPAQADADVKQLQDDWAVAMYETPKADREDAMATLAESARSLAAANPSDPAVLIWEGIVLSTWAGEKGGLGALSLCKEARAALETALSIDETALQGSAHTSLGSLYYQVPGWPVGFGNDDKAREHLQKALTMNPDGIDPNYFMAAFLHEDGDDKAALVYLDKAANAPARPGRELADKGRHEEIENLRREIGSD